MTFDAETEKILNDILELRTKEKLVPFIGAGFSANIDGLPIWKEFIKNLNKYIKRDTQIKINLEKVFDKNWMEATEYFYWKMGKGVLAEGKKIFQKTLLTEFDILEHTEVNDDTKWKQHILLINKFKIIYTTNWDRTLENVAYQRGPGCLIHICEINAEKMPSPITMKNPNNMENKPLIRIYKFHGCYQNVDSIVASEGDYYRRIRLLDKHPLDHKLQKDLQNNTFIFIGYDLNDVNVTYFLNQVREIETDTECTSNNLFKLYFVKLTGRSKIDKEKVAFYKDHKNIILVPLLTDREQTEMDKKIAKVKKNDEKKRVKQSKYKQKIIEFLERI